MGKSLSVERMIELEIWLVDNRPETNDMVVAMDYFTNYFSGDDYSYLIDAFSMPFHDVKMSLIRYDSSSPKMDELKFLGELIERFCKTSFDVLRRIRQVRRILKYIAKNPSIRIPNLDSKQIVDNSDWNLLVLQDKNSTKNVEFALNFDDRKKALVKKLEVLINMAEFNGITLEDLISEGCKNEKGTEVKLNKSKK